MRRIAIINQKGGVGKTTTTANLGAALAEQGRRVVLVDMDAQANLSLSLGVEAEDGSPTSYSVLVGETPFASALRATSVPNLSLVASHIDLSGAEMELASQIGREFLLRDALEQWVTDERARTGRAPADYVLFDCPPSLGLLSINALASAGEVLITLQTEFLALQGMSKLVGVVQLLRKRLNPELVVTGILPCLYESRLRLAREVLGEIRKYFPGQVLPVPIRANVKLAEAPSFGQTIFQYAPESLGAMDYRCAAREMLRMETRDPDLAGLPPFREAVLAGTTYAERATDHAARAVVRESAPPQVTPPAAQLKPSKRASSANSTPAESGESSVHPLPQPAVRAKKSAPVAATPPIVTPPAATQVQVTPPSVVRAPPAPASKLAPAAPSTAKAPPQEKRARRAPPVAARAITPPAPTPAAEPEPVKNAPPPAKTPRAARSPAAAAPAPRIAPAPAAATPAPSTTVASTKTKPASVPSAPKPKRVPPVTIVPAAQPTPKRGASSTPRNAAPARAPAPAPSSAPPVSSAPATARDETRVVRADDLPPLPPDAFEILASFGLDP